ncbi:nucleotide sugar dehydrogenase [Vagococcus carniphilus]|uniref:nucleotide sugar dehydrogenase n=1 Tax=Vagococcus carniphilus TaxID=218144 RepID=UPI00288F96F4|nr:nucleotide sugar dehydrogenase [Vagococcus carniphilus]MDT2830951.1 nucleotide sugar dehydrogenase [Vagococcus carniphilus]MDT2838152.1 nucleotide sugar dehydrogenase [Vagococcus carniphilus]MDT2853687.1 nucleotide sugar dehydrogenase [Vagococcus carniphilus]
MINVIGLGYIGLPTALMLAAHNNEIVGTDFNEKLVSTLKMGKTTFEEKGLDELFDDALSKGITFTTEYVSTDKYIITVPTPYDKDNKKIDPSYVIKAVNSVLEVCKKNTLLIIESTVSPGTIDKYIRPEIEKSNFDLGKTIHLIHAPERILPGNMIHELKFNSRTIGADNLEQGNKVKEIYKTFCKSDIAVTDIKTAEMSKVIENTYRDINIAFANELAKICRFDNMDVYEIIKVANMHPRVNILNPGPGVGGHCISVDPWFLVGDYPELTNIISSARHINDSMPDFVLKRLSEVMEENGITDRNKVGIYGLTYKQDVDDTRESPSLQLFDSMKKHLAPPLKSYDPMVKNKIVENQIMNFDEFLEDLDLVVVMVSHSHIKENLDKISNKIIFDTQNIIPNGIKL